MDSPCIKQTVSKVLKIFQHGKYLVAYVLKVCKSLALCACDLSTSYWPTESDILSNKSLPVRIYFDSNTQKDKKYEWIIQIL